MTDALQIEADRRNIEIRPGRRASRGKSVKSASRPTEPLPYGSSYANVIGTTLTRAARMLCRDTDDRADGPR